MKRSRYWVNKAKIEYRKLRATIRKDKYDRMAAELQDTLLNEWDQVTNEALADVIDGIRGGTPFSESHLNQLTGELRPYFSDRFTREVSQPMAEINAGVFTAGMRDGASDPEISPRVVDERAIEKLQEHNVYWVKHFYDQQLRDQIKNFGEQIISQGLNRQEAGEMFRQEFAEKYESYSWRYWEGFANHVTTRSREMGAVSGYERAEIERVEVRAVIDHRTTEICQHMHGRFIDVRKLVEVRDQLLNADTPEDVKNITPWPKNDQVAGTRTQDLPKGAEMPPYHFNCRTRTVGAPSEVSYTSLEGIQNPTDTQIQNRLNYAASNHEQLSPDEIQKLVDKASRAGWSSHKRGGKSTSRDHFEKHGGRKYINADSLTEYNQQMMDIVTSDDRDIYIQKHLNKHPQILFRKNNVNVVYEPRIGHIKTMFPEKDATFQRKKNRVILKLDNARGIQKWLKKLQKMILK